MKKMTIRKMLERIVVATNKRRAKNIAEILDVTVDWLLSEDCK